MYQRKHWFWLLLPLLSLLVLVSANSVLGGRPENRRDYTDFLKEVRQGKIERVEQVGDGPRMVVKNVNSDKRWEVLGPPAEVLYSDVKANRPAGSDLTVEHRKPSIWPEVLKVVLLCVLLAVTLRLVYGSLLRQMTGSQNQTMAFSRSRAQRLSDTMPRKTFDDVAGVDEAKEELAEIVDFLRHRERYEKLGAEIPKGVLLMGPPGCGKTLLARAVAGEAEVPFFHISGSDFVEMFVGVGASRVRDLFEQAKAHRPCIVFIDELDAVGRHRGAGLGGGHDEREQTVNQLLVEMDGFEPNTGIIVMAATNRPDILDPALLRPGRFDRRVVVDAPDVNGRIEILELYIKSKPIASDVEIDVLARQTPGLTGADLFSIVNEAGILAARLDRDRITMSDFEEAIERVVSGRERKSRVLLASEKRTVAYHEAGHAIISHFLPHCTPVHKISIVQRGMALGYVMTLPEEERHNHSRTELLAAMVQLLGGRAAETLVFGAEHITTGAQNDLERVTELARAMVCEYGMSDEIGPRTLGRRHGPVFLGRDINEERNYSEEIARLVDKEIRRLVDESYERAEAELADRRELMDKLVETLMERETLGAAEVHEVLGPPPPKVGVAAEELVATSDEPSRS